MAIVTIRGSLFEAPQKILAHGVNCRGAFGAGVARFMAKYHPFAQTSYFDKFLNGGWRLGDVQFVQSKGKIIANCATQKSYGNSKKSGIVYLDYDALEKVMKQLYLMESPIAIPKIGCGLAGGDWKKVRKIINDIFVDRDIYVYYI